MRLIDADALQIALIKKYDEVADLLEIVDNQLTAYDVDKVVAELKELQDAISNHIEKWKEYKKAMMFNFTHIDVLDDAINIVRRGGN